MTEKPTNPGKAWVPGLLFDAPSQTPAPKKTSAFVLPSFAPESAPAAPSVNAAPTVAEAANPAPPAADGTTMLAEAAQAAPAEVAPESIGDLERHLVTQEKALRDIRIHCRNLQDSIAKAKHGFMFGDKSKMATAKEKMEALTAEHQQGEVEERRLVSETLTLRTRIERLRR